MSCRTVIGIFCVLIFACEEEPTMERSPDPPPSPTPVQPVAEAVPEAAPANEAPAAKAPKPEKPAPEPPAPRPKTDGPVSGAALGGAKTTQLVQRISPTAQVAPDVSIRIVSPTPSEIIKRSTLKVRVRMKNFSPYKSDDERGRWLKVVLDNEVARDWYDPDDNPFEISGLSPGWHTVRVFAKHENGECIKDPSAFDAINFYVRTDKNAPKPLNFSDPMLTYNLPTGTYAGDNARAIPLDFHLANTQLKQAGHRLRVKVGALPAFELTAWTAVSLLDVPPGTHTMQLTLLGPNGQPVSHPWNPLEHQFTVKE